MELYFLKIKWDNQQGKKIDLRKKLVKHLRKCFANSKVNSIKRSLARILNGQYLNILLPVKNAKETKIKINKTAPTFRKLRGHYCYSNFLPNTVLNIIFIIIPYLKCFRVDYSYFSGFMNARLLIAWCHTVQLVWAENAYWHLVSGLCPSSLKNIFQGINVCVQWLCLITEIEEP